ncbi:MATE family efflux transporter [Pseudomonas granadensis]|uniref:Multidrug-efflux transporter n=1 Tax=Pseudomonas granadensis TaxID=1421430 RepID=A0ABX7GBE4_9PSED|nr:MATE family efflux transporter [Pseudomonas granadensis]MBN6776203.1 MATE family efflux transporter [Pseudomonas granadensis]MBN6807221.1 MATE family efflux transporter [Pseudomonas granadensis]MBN6834187.1 MATE family efflux transporter [Pseudomonas granadensis]MBN6841596.1 MATE family efflux transporter [Pseudomonas granadensis]MBN6870375.1 MATE family efflux transporter [Pseudomonas granadensis]
MNSVTDQPVAVCLSRPARIRLELKTLLALALPIIIAQLATTAMGFVDAVMAGRVGPKDLAAVALGNSIWVPVFLLMTGTLLATTPKVAQRFGAGTHSEIGPIVRQALWLALVVGLIATSMLVAAEPVLHLMNVDPELIGPCMQYLHGIASGLPAVAIYHVLRCFSDGLGRTRPAMVLGLCGLALNIPLNYIFIYGHFGVPAMGGVGCGWATAIVMWVMALGLAGYERWAPVYRSSELFSRFDWPQWAVIKRLLAIGLPIGIAVFAESSIFAVIALLIGSLGATVVAGHQIALNVSSLVFMIPYSLGMAVTVRVGQALGREEPREARFAAGVGMATALAYACLSASMMLVLREPIAAIYTADPTVIHIAAMLIVYSALFQFSDAIQVTAAGALRGYQDTRVTMILTLFAYWGIGLPVGYALGLTDWLGEPRGPSGLWQGLIVGLSCAALMLSIRLTRSARKRIRISRSAG